MSQLTAALISSVVLCTSVFAQVEDDAKKVLDESKQAMRSYEGVSMKAKRSATGMLAAIVDSDATIKVWTPKGKSERWIRVDGRTKQPGKGDKKIVFVSDGKTAQWLDFEKNTLYVRPVTDPMVAGEMNTVNQTYLADFESAKPFEQVMGMKTVKKTGSDTINGEVCDIIEGVNETNDRNFIWAVSAKDRLPRRFFRGTGAQNILAESVDFSDVKTSEKFSAKDFEIALPTGFGKDTQTSPNPNAQTPVNVDVPRVEMGLKVGTPAPAFSSRDADGKEISLDSIKGKPVVLVFWGPMFKQSVSALDQVKNAGQQMADVEIVGVVCREMVEGSAKKAWTDKSMKGRLVPAGDQISTDYKVAGYPTFVVVGADGTVAGYFQDFPGGDALKAAAGVK